MSFVKRTPSAEAKCLLFSETFIVVKEEHSRNGHSPIVVVPSGMIIDVKEEHQENAPPPIVVIPFGMVIDVKEEHLQNAHSPIVVTLFGIVMEVKEEQSSNAHSPIVVTLFGMVIDVKEEHLQNAPLPIVVTFLEIFTFLIDSLVEFHGMPYSFIKSVISPLPLIARVQFNSIPMQLTPHIPVRLTLFGIIASFTFELKPMNSTVEGMETRSKSLQS